MSHYSGPLLTRPLAEALLAARDGGAGAWRGSLDLGRSIDSAALETDAWQWRGQRYPYPATLKDRTIYYWDGEEFAPVSRFSGSLIKLVPTEWGAPTFEIDGIKMLPTSKESPFDDARRKVALIEPRGKLVLDTCGGLGYFAACCLEAGVAAIQSFEKNADVLWLRTLNPWSPDPEAAASGGRLQLDPRRRVAGDHPDCRRLGGCLAARPAALRHRRRTVFAGLLRPAGARAARGGRLFHYTGSPNKLTSGRDVPREVATRLEKAGFKAQLALDGVLAVRR